MTMKTEFEAKYQNINITDLRRVLKSAGAKLLKKQFKQKRYAFNLPAGKKSNKSWLRVRDEGGKITLSLKRVGKGSKITEQKEICITVSDFESAAELLRQIGCRLKSYQETKREIWTINDVEISVDQWPFLEPFVEIEGQSEKAVKKVSKLLGFNYKDATFGAVDTLYSSRYHISKDRINNHTPLITFKDPNPFI